MEKKKLTREELSRIRSEAGRKGALAANKSGNRRGGRPRSVEGPAVRIRSLSVRDPDYLYIQKVAFRDGKAIAAMVHEMVELHKYECGDDADAESSEWNRRHSSNESSSQNDMTDEERLAIYNKNRALVGLPPKTQLPVFND